MGNIMPFNIDVGVMINDLIISGEKDLSSSLEYCFPPLLPVVPIIPVVIPLAVDLSDAISGDLLVRRPTINTSGL